METISNDADYKLAINRIALLSVNQNPTATELAEINQLSLMAMNYEYRKYDFAVNMDLNQQGFNIQQA